MADETENSNATISPARLWFGTITAAVSWALLGCIDILINWRACQHQDRYGIPPHVIGPRILIGCIALVLLAIVLIAGVISYRNWQRLTPQPDLLRTHAVERREYMAFLGLIMTVTMGMGIVWLALPPIFLNICWRAR
jgi:heme/copper-type cytochrome/quinol oxidase subunit 2